MTRIYEGEKHILIHADYTNPAEHRHMAAHMILSLDAEIEAVVDGKIYRCCGLMIPSGSTHRINTFGQATLVFLFDHMTNAAKTIREVHILENTICQNIIRRYHTFEKSKDVRTYMQMERCILEQLHIDSVTYTVTDPRVHMAITRMRSCFSENPTCGEIAKSVFLSQSRFAHLFKQQTGMRFPVYLIYQRLMYVYAEVFAGKTITEAVWAAGFSGSAHFADVHRRVFGLPMRAVLREWTFLKIE